MTWRSAAPILLLFPAVPALAEDAPRAEVVASRNFAIAPPSVRQKNGAVRVEGAVCRRANYFGLSPLRIQVEAYGPDGALVATKIAYLPPLSGRADQRCGRYATAIGDASQPVSKIRICLARGGHCPSP